MLISEKRYETTKRIFEKYDIVLPSEIIKEYSNVFEVIAHFVNNKLSDEEIFTAYVFLNNFLLNKEAKYNVFVSKKERISAQVRVMEEMPETAGRLTMEEKIGFAFCMYTAVCLEKYDEENDRMVWGVSLFSSINNIEENLKMMRELRPEFFPVEEKIVVNREDYGLSEKNPIRLTSVHMSYEYLRSLTYEGKPIEFRRKSSMFFDDRIIDKYTILKTKGSWFFKEEIIAELYINPNCDTAVKIAPKGFEIAEPSSIL